MPDTTHEILLPIARKRFERKVRSRNKLKQRRREELEDHISKKRFKEKKRLQHKEQLIALFGELTYSNILKKWLPPNIHYIISHSKSAFYFDFEKVKIRKEQQVKFIDVPEVFSLIQKPDEAFEFLNEIIRLLLCEEFHQLFLNYETCKSLDIGAQVLLDIILKEIFEFYDKCQRDPFIDKIARVRKTRVTITHPSRFSEKIRKILYSVGSFAIHQKKSIQYDDIIDYKLCIHNRAQIGDPLKIAEQKEIDTTTLVDYVIDCLKRFNKQLTPEKIEDLCTVIGEILINAEEHSTTKYRFSIGYFHEQDDNGKHIGIFRLVILNFGRTIYEKFKDPNCPNKAIVEKMTNLSKQYTKSGFFTSKAFEEESLWTLYALQEGVTSTNQIRGNGSIQFIESFFNIKGTNTVDDNTRMTIYSGNTRIIFDGTYQIMLKQTGEEKFKVMTFNESGNIEDKPDGRYVRFDQNYFPGTIISARILINEDDVTYDN